MILHCIFPKLLKYRIPLFCFTLVSIPMKKLLVCIILISVISNGCNLNKVSGATDNPHETKIFVELSGKYAIDEVADVTIGGGGASTIGKGFSPQAYATVDPGTYTISATAHNVQGTWSHTTTIAAGEQKTITLPCNGATVTVQPDALWIGTHNNFHVEVTDPEGNATTFVVPAGGSNSTIVHPGKGIVIYITDADKGTVLTQTSVDLFYNTKFTLNIPYK